MLCSLLLLWCPCGWRPSCMVFLLGHWSGLDLQTFRRLREKNVGTPAPSLRSRTLSGSQTATALMHSQSLIRCMSAVLYSTAVSCLLQSSSTASVAVRSASSLALAKPACQKRVSKALLPPCRLMEVYRRNEMKARSWHQHAQPLDLTRAGLICLQH